MSESKHQARIIDAMPAADYHADPAPAPSLSSSIAKILLSKSPRAAWGAHPRLGRTSIARDDAKQFDVGTSAHAMLLEEDDSRIVVIEADDWRTKAARELRDAAHASGKTALLAHDFVSMRKMVDVARRFIASSEIADSWRDAKSEQTILWCEDGAWLRARPDRLASDHHVIVDYKTTSDVSPDAFTRQIVALGYHIQDALYRRAVKALSGGYETPKFVFLAQETEPPFECALYACDPELQEIGQFAVDRAIDAWREALKTNDWKGYGSRVHWAAAPLWLRAQHEEYVNG